MAAVTLLCLWVLSLAVTAVEIPPSLIPYHEGGFRDDAPSAAPQPYYPSWQYHDSGALKETMCDCPCASSEYNAWMERSRLGAGESSAEPSP